jgi:hypothetical protein
MVSFDIPSLFPPPDLDDKAVTDIAFFNFMDDEEIIVDDDPAKDDQSDEESSDEEAEQDGADKKKKPKFNPDKQSLHPNEDKLRGKFVIDVPTFTSYERRLIAATSHVRAFLTNSETATANIPRELLTVVKMAKTCKILDGRVVKVKTRGGLKEIPETLVARKQVLLEAHDGEGHKGLDGTMENITPRYWMPAWRRSYSGTSSAVSPVKSLPRPTSSTLRITRRKFGIYSDIGVSILWDPIPLMRTETVMPSNP